MPFRPALLIALAALPGVASAAPEIVRCVGPGGGVSYQQTACPDSSIPQRTAIPIEFPPQNLAERERLFEREAALHRRLEARRDRELQEAQIREARAEREAERERLAVLAAQAAQPQYVIAYPLVARHWAPGHRRTAPPGVTRNQSIFR